MADIKEEKTRFDIFFSFKSLSLSLFLFLLLDTKCVSFISLFLWCSRVECRFWKIEGRVGISYQAFATFLFEDEKFNFLVCDFSFVDSLNLNFEIVENENFKKSQTYRQIVAKKL